MIQVDFSSMVTMLFTAACVTWVTMYVRRLNNTHEDAEKKKREIHAARDQKVADLENSHNGMKIEQAALKATVAAQDSTMTKVQQDCGRILDILTRSLKINAGGHE